MKRSAPGAKPVLLFQLRPETPASDGEYEAILRHGRLRPDAVERVRLDAVDFPEVDLDRYSAILVGGSPFEVSTPEAEKSLLQRRIEAGFQALLDRVVAADFPFLGACSGNGLLGAWCGVSLSGRYSEPVGGADVSLTEAGRVDPLLEGLPDRFRVLLGHKEACDAVPPGAVLLAGSEACPVQMFRVGENVYATQFHPEGDPEGFAVRIDVYRHYGYFPAERAEALLDAVKDEHTPHAQAILARFVERYAPHARDRKGGPADVPVEDPGPS
jgi:GMP synthase (glutamine-hydrolysing)